MAASVGIQYDGLKQALREIQKVDPALRRQITKDIKNAMNPLFSAIKDSIPSSPPLTGQKHNGRTGWKAESKNVTIKVDTRKARSRNLSQGAQFESVGNSEDHLQRVQLCQWQTWQDEAQTRHATRTL
jgi:hypothetical protein